MTGLSAATAPEIGLGVDFAADWLAFRDERERAIRSPHGFLAVTGLHWLTETAGRFTDVPGSWEHHPDDGVVVTLAEHERLALAGAPLRDRYALGRVDEVGLLAEFGSAVVEVASRAGVPFLRPRHPDSPGLAGYTGTPCYQPDPSWVVPGSFRAHPTPVPVEVETVIPGRGGVIDAVGELVFSTRGRPQRLLAFAADRDPGGLWVLFTDETSGVTTYAATRQLVVPPPDAAGRVVLDFNRALNMPCAYTDFATCPLPPLGNHIDVLVEAGEQIPPRCG